MGGPPPNDPYVPYEKPDGNIGLIFLKHSFHKYHHYVHNNEFGVPTFPLHEQELYCARRDTMDHFVRSSRSFVCTEILRSLEDRVREAHDGLNTEVERLRHELNKHVVARSGVVELSSRTTSLDLLTSDEKLSSSSSSVVVAHGDENELQKLQKLQKQQQQQQHWLQQTERYQREIEEIGRRMERLTQIYNQVIAPHRNMDNTGEERQTRPIIPQEQASKCKKEEFTMNNLDEHVKQSLTLLGIQPPDKEEAGKASSSSLLVQDQSHETITDSMNRQLTKCRMGVPLPPQFYEQPATVDTELVKYYNCLHASFANVLMIQTVGKCRSHLAEFRVCHTRLIKMPNIKEDRWNRYVSCIKRQNEWLRRHMNDELHFYEKPNWFHKLWKGREL